MHLTCYACNSPATTVEHVPPRCLFPEQKDLPKEGDLRINLITVPSCKEHNLEKSGNDQYLLYVLTMNSETERLGGQHFETKVMRTINRRPALINSLLSESIRVKVKPDITRNSKDELAIPIDEARLNNILRYMALGIYRHLSGANWVGPVCVCSEFLRYIEGKDADNANSNLAYVYELADELLDGEPYRGTNTRVFKYQIVNPGHHEVNTVMRMTFFGGVRVLVMFGMEQWEMKENETNE